MAFSAQPCAEIDLCDYLFLREISELDHNGLRLVLEEGTAGSEEISSKVGDTVITGGHRVESTDEGRLFEVVWQFYVAYSVRNESFVSHDEHELSVGEKFRIYTKSHFLDFIRSATFATNEYPGPIQHISVNCEDHIVDVVSTKEAEVKRIRPILSQTAISFEHLN
jgi:hypothetical protein